MKTTTYIAEGGKLTKTVTDKPEPTRNELKERKDNPCTLAQQDGTDRDRSV